MEADFQREYNLNLKIDLPRLSWRRFMVLLRGLSPNSATITQLNASRYFGRKDVVEVTTPEQATATIKGLYSQYAKGTH